MGLRDHLAGDLTAIFAQGLAVDATHVNGATNETLRVIFDDEHEVSNDGMVSTSTPRILIATDAMGNVDIDSTFTIDGTAFHAVEIRPDNDGLTEIILSEVDA